MNKLYLFTRQNTQVMTWPVDVYNLGGYVSVNIGAEYPTFKEGFEYLRSAAMQEHIMRVGYTRYIVDAAGNPLWKAEVTVTETYF